MRQQQIILIRGLPGSGKSTMAKTQYPDAVHLEADMYFIDHNNGEYRFDASKLKAAHEWCRVCCMENLEVGNPVVVVSNTFTQRWEMAPYFKIAKQYQAAVTVLIATGNYKNIHGVPDEVIAKMKARWEDCCQLKPKLM